jgi:hypothetical protein
VNWKKKCGPFGNRNCPRQLKRQIKRGVWEKRFIIMNNTRKQFASKTKY